MPNRPTDNALGTLKHWYHDGRRETVVSNGDAQSFHVGTLVGYLGGNGDLVVNGGGEASVVDGENGGCGVGAHGVISLAGWRLSDNTYITRMAVLHYRQHAPTHNAHKRLRYLMCKPAT